jgi:hypothetical protein
MIQIWFYFFEATTIAIDVAVATFGEPMHAGFQFVEARYSVQGFQFMMLAYQIFFLLEFQYFLLGRSLSDGAQYKTSRVHLKFGMSKMLCELLKILTVFLKMVLPTCQIYAVHLEGVTVSRVSAFTRQFVVRRYDA